MKNSLALMNPKTNKFVIGFAATLRDLNIELYLSYAVENLCDIS
jgi:hypothetical protein